MTRPMSAEMEAALEGSIIYPIYFFEIGAADDQWLRLWTGRGDREWDGKTWAGVGWILGMSEVEETSETKASNFVIGMPANAQVIQIALAEFRRNKPVNIWQGLLSSGIEIGTPEDDEMIGEEDTGLVIGEPAGLLIDEPLLIASGYTDISEIDIDIGKPAIRINCESKFADMERARVRRYTIEDHQIEYPDDLFFAQVGALTDKTLTWGKDQT